MLGLGLGVSIQLQPCGCSYTSITLPRMLYGAEIWCLTNTEHEMFERAHRKILRTIQGLPVRCPKESISTLLGCSTISDLIIYKKLSFLISIVALPPTALPRQVLQCRLDPRAFYKAPAWNSDQWPEITEHCYPSSKYSIQKLLEEVCN